MENVTLFNVLGIPNCVCNLQFSSLRKGVEKYILMEKASLVNNSSVIIVSRAFH